MNSPNYHCIVKNALKKALLCVKNEKNRLELDYVSERTIVGRIAHHLSSIIESKGENLNVDVEYSVGLDSERKRLDANPEFVELGKRLGRKIREDFNVAQICIIPDIIIHERGPAGLNIAAIEVKVKSTLGSDESCYAQQKLKLLKESQYGYKVGVFINLPLCWNDFAEESNLIFIE